MTEIAQNVSHDHDYSISPRRRTVHDLSPTLTDSVASEHPIDYWHRQQINTPVPGQSGSSGYGDQVFSEEAIDLTNIKEEADLVPLGLSLVRASKTVLLVTATHKAVGPVHVPLNSLLVLPMTNFFHTLAEERGVSRPISRTIQEITCTYPGGSICVRRARVEYDLQKFYGKLKRWWDENGDDECELEVEVKLHVEM